MMKASLYKNISKDTAVQFPPKEAESILRILYIFTMNSIGPSQ